MELELDRTQMSGYEKVLDTTVCHEETMETIVPDACPDMLRICDTEGRVCLRSKDAQEGRVELAGTVRAVVLYLPDGGEGMRRIEIAIPFTCNADAPGVTPACSVVAVPRVQSCDARAINPRKVLVRVNVAIDLRVYAPMVDCICSGCCCDGDVGVEQMVEFHETYMVACVQEKTFTFADDVTIPGSRPAAVELLKHRLELRCNEAKVIGNKLIFKGDTALQLLYRGDDSALHSAEYELPFSQIMEVTGAGEDAACEVRVIAASADCVLEPGDGRTVSVSLVLLAQAVVREGRTMQMLTDVYSNGYDLSAETQPYTINRLLDQNVKGQTVREILETGALAKAVSDAYVSIGAVTQGREGARLTVTAEARVTVLYQEEDNSIGSVTRSISVSCPLELPEGAICSCQCECPGELYATPTTGGIEVRFSVEFRYQALSSRKVVGVCAIRMDESAPRSSEGKPSIVLRMVDGHERLWDVAKSYGTTARDIMQANDLAEDMAPAGQLLLIPRKR